MRRAIAPATAARAGKQAPDKWTPERRLMMALSVLERNAKRYRWSAEELAAAKDKARKKAGL